MSTKTPEQSAIATLLAWIDQDRELSRDDLERQVEWLVPQFRAEAAELIALRAENERLRHLLVQRS